MKVHTVTPAPRVIVDLEAQEWLRIEEHAKYQAKKAENWTIVNMLASAFEEARKAIER